MSNVVVIKPRVSEKAYSQSEERNTYVFDVDKNVNVLSIAKAVEAQYEVTVLSVRLAATASKTRRSYKRRGRVVHKGVKPAVRKAYVTLAEGDKLPIFAAAENASKAPEDKK